MKRLMLAMILMVMCSNTPANAGVRTEIGVAQEQTDTRYSDAENRRVWYDASNNQSALVSVGYLKQVADGFGIETNVSSGRNAIRVEANATKEVGDGFLMKAGPAWGASFSEDQFAFGYQISGEARINESSFVSTGYYGSSYVGCSGGICRRTDVGSMQVRIGFDF